MEFVHNLDSEKILKWLIFTAFLFHLNVAQSNTYKNCYFKGCLCSFKSDTDRYYLYCNDPKLKSIPDFSMRNRSSLVFAKLDFTRSGITQISGI